MTAQIQIEKAEYHQHSWLMKSASEMPDPDQVQVIVTIWECSDCQEQRFSWGLAT